MDQRIDILFFERPLADLRKYALKIAGELRNINPEISLATISLELPTKVDCANLAHWFRQEDIHDIDKFLLEYHVQMIVFTNPRIPDMEMILHAHKLNIKTVMIQEGVIFDGATINDINARNIAAVLNFIPKTVQYFMILFEMCQYDQTSYLKLLGEILTQKKNITKIIAHYFSPHLIADYVLTMGNHWHEYYRDVMGYMPKQIKTMGDHDLDGFVSCGECEDAVCYIATVLVEDGTRTRKEFGTFIHALANVISKETKLYVKLHPRSDISLYDPLKSHNVTFVRSGQLPKCKIYIGHRSTLLARALYESNDLIIWKFPNEKDDFFERFASRICSCEEKLRGAVIELSSKEYTNNKRTELERVFWINPNGAIKSAAQMIHQYVKEGYIS